MYDVSRLISAYSGLVGIRQSNDVYVPLLESPIIDSESGIYADNKMPLCSTENMFYSSPGFEPINYPSWQSGRNYKINSIVQDQEIIYKSKAALTNHLLPPASDPTNWDVYNPFNNWIKQKVEQAISNMFAEVVKRKKLLHMAKAILERMQLYRGFGSARNKIVKQGRFVGLAIYPQQAEGLWVIINQIGIQATDANPNMKYYLYFTDNLAAEWTWDVDVSLVNTFSWADLKDTSTIPKENCILKYLKNNTSGFYIIGYYEDDLIGQAISKTWDCTSAPCEGCDNLDLSLYNQWSRYTSIRTVSVPASAINADRTIFDVSRIEYNNLTNWGLNLNITVRCDLTDFLIYSKYLFADAVAMQICKEFLESIANGIRLGPSPAQTKLSAVAALDVKGPNPWINQYNDIIEGLNLDLSGFSNACMPCEDEKTIKFFSM